MKKLLPLAAALTFTLTACSAPASSAAVPTTTEVTELQAVGSGEDHTPRHARRPAPEFGVDEISNAPEEQADRRHRRRQIG